MQTGAQSLSAGNKYGRALIDLCKAGELTIANGRLFSDAGVGDFTRAGTTGRSTVDYVCVSSIDLESIIDFRVHDLIFLLFLHLSSHSL